MKCLAKCRNAHVQKGCMINATDRCDDFIPESEKSVSPPVDSPSAGWICTFGRGQYCEDNAETSNSPGDISRTLDSIVRFFAKPMMVCLAMNMISISWNIDSPTWVFLTYQPIVFFMVAVAMNLKSNDKREPTRD